MKRFAMLPPLLMLLPGLAAPAWGMKNQERNFPQSCVKVWTAALTVAKSQQYRVIGISEQEQIISVVVGGVWGGERILSMSLAPGVEKGCTATVQSRFSGLAHSDGPMLLDRLQAELIGESVDRSSKEFQRFQNCMEKSLDSEAKCQAKLAKTLAKEAEAHPSAAPAGIPASMGSKDNQWWQTTKPQK